MKFEVIKFYWQCLARALRELLASYGLATRVQITNTLLTIAPFIILSTVKIANKGLRTFFDDIATNSLDMLIGFTWFAVLLLINLIRSPYLLKKGSDQRVIALKRQLDAITDKQKTRLAIEFQESSPWIQSSGENTLLRLRVKNLSPVEPLHNVKLQLDAIEPMNLPALPMTLHQMHDNPLPGTHNLQTFDLAPSGFHFIDVVNIVKSGQEVFYVIEHAVRNVPKNPLIKLSSITVSAYSDNCSPQTETFDISMMNSKAIFIRQQRGA